MEHFIALSRITFRFVPGPNQHKAKAELGKIENQREQLNNEIKQKQIL